MAGRTEHVNYIHRFTEEEVDELGKRLSDSLAAYGEVENEKKEEAARYGAQLKKLRQTLDVTNRKIRDGYEERSGECSVTRDVRSQRVLYHLLETGDLVKERDFEGKDFQLAIDDGLYDNGGNVQPPRMDDDDDHGDDDDDEDVDDEEAEA